MTKRTEITILTDVELITCIIQKGKADEVVTAAFEAGAHGATVNYAQGSGVRESLGILSVAVEAEKEIINLVVSSEQLNRVFDAMYIAGNLGTPGMGFMYVSKIEKAATFIPQDILQKLGIEQ